ncbi:4-(cytidine 5'-diphospho)-2-C-methyl-D-erythritol kinase [Brevifollis gellanilyticus]|uniref:4-diphosphocytidyl-2-C-methyl-D-erythritol kinase n=1 Tax=Brevifollis gellanilyticus TaxID=748831 RepID=A0A512M6U3_9BACT|nr:4-(cytidine 5'-diphospho)-2-C-methyl-D-erythritol kinase [Brevifollis gellanilyticus]GEP42456.1 4-diphosphocytidyl-2-C-methyl-D-erythritol kinase [Brevifollis gellanilyticus]
MPAPTSLDLPSYAKINLWLRVLGKREDGFHEVETRLVKIDVADTVSLTLTGGKPGISLTCNVPGIPTDDSNLAIKALRAFEARAGISQGWSIHLEKRIPHGAGLGGGSGNAATILKAANQLLSNPLPLEALIEIAAGIGSDVPCFLLDAPAADGSGRGERVVPAEFPWQLPMVLIKPNFPIPTPWAYKNWATSKELPGVLYAPQLCPWGAMVNDLERPVFEKHRLLPALKTWLLDRGGVRAALMSGSGSTMFAITQTEVQAAALAEEARHYCGDTAWVQVTRTLASE